MLNAYDAEELIKHKTDCIMSRIEGKDFFDLYYLVDLPHKPVKSLKEKKEKIIGRISLEEKEIKSIVLDLRGNPGQKWQVKIRVVEIYQNLIDEAQRRLNGESPFTDLRISNRNSISRANPMP